MTESDVNNNVSGSENQSAAQNRETAPELSEPTPVALELEDLRKQIDQYKDLLLRKAAEFDNYKRRTENETAAFVKYANESLLEELLPVLDDFERSLKHGKENNDYDALLKGIELIYQKFSKLIEGRGVKAFETEGKEFSVDFHDALMQMPRSDVPPHTVIQEVQKGYMMHDKVLRHAKVVVSTAPAEKTAGEQGKE